MTASVGLIGVGRIGLPVCTNLVAAGNAVVAFDRRPDRKAPVLAAGARWEPSVTSLAAAVDVLITVLPGSPELQEAMSRAIPALRPGTTWIDMTSAAPTFGDELRGRLHARGCQCLDAPVGGGIAAAAQGTVQLYVGGPSTLLERHRELLEAVGSINHVGGHGAGYTVKLLVNLLWFGQAVATAEAMLLARRAGIDLDVLRMALTRSAASSEFIRRDLGALLNGDYLRSFGLDRCCEELDAVAALAGDLEVPFELSSAVRAAYARAFERYGAADGELLPVALLEEQAGISLRRARPEPAG